MSVNSIITNYAKRRLTKFANAHKCNAEDVHVHNNKPIWYLMKKYKEQNAIKSRLFKSLSTEQQAAWIAFYDANKELKIMTTEEHNQFHNTHTFNPKTEQWQETAPSTLPPLAPKLVSSHKPVKN